MCLTLEGTPFWLGLKGNQQENHHFLRSPISSTTPRLPTGRRRWRRGLQKGGVASEVLEAQKEAPRASLVARFPTQTPTKAPFTWRHENETSSGFWELIGVIFVWVADVQGPSHKWQGGTTGGLG